MSATWFDHAIATVALLAGIAIKLKIFGGGP